MKKVNEYIVKYLNNDTMGEDRVHILANFIEDFFVDMDDEHSDLRETFYEELEDLTYEADEETLMQIVENLKHKDGTHVGQKWTKAEVASVAKQYDAKSKIEALDGKYCELKFWFMMNYVYAVHYSVSRSVNGYIELAIDELMNKNLCFNDLVRTIFDRI